MVPFVSALTRGNHLKLLGLAESIPKHLEGLKYSVAKFVSISEVFQANALTTPMLRELDSANMTLQEYLREQEQTAELAPWAESVYNATKELEMQLMRSNFGKFRTETFKRRQKSSAARIQKCKEQDEQERSRSRARRSRSHSHQRVSRAVPRPASPVRMASPVRSWQDPSPLRRIKQKKVHASKSTRPRERNASASDDSYTYTDYSDSEKREATTAATSSSAPRSRPPGMPPMMPFGSDKPSGAAASMKEKEARTDKKVKKEKGKNLNR